MPKGVVYVGRGSDFGNPFAIGDCVYSKSAHFNEDATLHDGVLEVTPQNCLRLFGLWATQMAEHYPVWLERLRGKDLACWCKEGEPCHADILLQMANQPSP